MYLLSKSSANAYNACVSHRESFNVPPPGTPEAIEARIEKYLEKLPPELRERWEHDLAGVGNDQLAEAEKRLHAAVGKRGRILRSSPSLFSDTEHLVSNKKAISETLKIVREAEQQRGLFVGAGKVAHVYKSPRNPGLCYKIVHNLTKYEEWNSVDKEGHYLEALGNVEVEGVRVPHVSSIIDRPDTKVIEMEYLDAISIEKALTSGNAILNDLDIDTFFERLRAYVVTMHETFNIYHRDLHEGNILIGRNGMPYVIDFGCATRSFDPDTAYESLDKFGQKMFRFVPDEDRLYAVERKIRDYRSTKSL